MKRIVQTDNESTCTGIGAPDMAKASSEAETGQAESASTTEDFFNQVNIEFLIHELKSPVSIIDSAASLLLNKQDPSAALTSQQQNTIQRILRNTSKMSKMLSELLEMGRARDACFNCHSFNPMAALRNIVIEVTESVAPELCQYIDEKQANNAKLSFLAKNGIRIEASNEMETVTVEQDEFKFCQVVGNLVKNGMYYRRRNLIIHATRRKNNLSISVRDDGPGIAPEHHEAIFERYKQVAPCDGVARKGHGLGLAMARILARSMGGDILLESELGQGALFHLNLPTVFPGIHKD